MTLYHYLVRLETVLRSRQDIDIEVLQIDVITLGVAFTSELRFHDGSRLTLVEQLESIGKRDYLRVNYKYHYQDSNRNLIFRYDSAPHHPNLAKFPAHKHVGNTIVEADPPDLNDVLAEIDGILYPDLDQAG